MQRNNQGEWCARLSSAQQHASECEGLSALRDILDWCMDADPIGLKRTKNPAACRGGSPAMKTAQQRPPVGVVGGSRNLSSLGAPPATSRRTRAEGPSFRAVMPKLGRAPSGCGGVGVGLGGGSQSVLSPESELLDTGDGGEGSSRSHAAVAVVRPL
jgi:hypothetical protein